MSRKHHRLDKRLWERTRLAVFARDGYRCKACGKSGRLECDHVEPLDRDPDQDHYTVDGLQNPLPGVSYREIKTRGPPRPDT